MREETHGPWLSALLKVAFSASLLAWLVGHAELAPLLRRLSALRPGYYLLGLATMLVYVAVQALILRVLFAAGREPPALMGVVRHLLISTFFGVLLPGGNGADIVLCCRLFRTPLSRERVVSGVVFARLATLGAMGVLAGVGGLLPGCPVRGLPGFALLLLAAGVAAYALLVFGPGTRLVSRLGLGRHRLFSFVGRSWGELIAVARDRRVVLRILPGLFAVALLRVVIDYLAARALGLDLPIVWFLTFAPVVTLASAIPISLAGLGVREGTYVGLMAIVGVSAADTVSFSLLSFTFILWLCLWGAGLYAFSYRRDRTPVGQ